MNQEQLEKLEASFKSTVDQVMEQKLAEVVSPLVAAETKKIVQQMRVERAVLGRDRTGLDEEQKQQFVSIVKSAALGMRTKAGEAMIEEVDSRGGYLVPKEIASAIYRIAASVGLILNQATKWDMTTDELGIPAYTGAFLEGEYLGVDAAGSVTPMPFSEANLIAKKWQLAFVVGNDLLADATVNLADWLLALGGESLANSIDKEGFNGAGTPFVGILNNVNVPTFSLPAGESTFASFKVIDDANDTIANLDESVLDGAAWYMHRTVWAKLKSQKDTAGNYILQQPGSWTFPQISANAGQVGGIKPVGELAGYPVYTTRHLPSIAASAHLTKYLVFGNLKSFSYGDRGDMKVAQSVSGSFGGKEIALADQTGLVIKHRHALVAVLPKAFVNVETAA